MKIATTQVPYLKVGIIVDQHFRLVDGVDAAGREHHVDHDRDDGRRRALLGHVERRVHVDAVGQAGPVDPPLVDDHEALGTSTRRHTHTQS